MVGSVVAVDAAVDGDGVASAISKQLDCCFRAL